MSFADSPAPSGTSTGAGAGSSSQPATDSTPSASSASQTPLQIWKDFDLNGRRSALDKQGLDIADRQEASAATRKQLAVSTRNFKKSLSEGTPISSKDVGSLLRLYQTEIDTLTNRAKAAEGSFLALYKALDDAPDPVEELEQAAKQTQTIGELGEELRVLRDERGGLVERTAAATKYEKRIEELEAELNGVNDRIEEEARAKTEEKQAQWMDAQQTTIEAYEMREQELLHQLRLGNDSARRLQSNTDDLQRQLNDAHSQIESAKNSRASVSEMALEDLERNRAEAKSLRRRCIELESRLNTQGGDGLDGTPGNSSVGRSALSAELAARDVEVSQLKDQVNALEEVLGGKDQEKRHEFATLTTSIALKDAELLGLRQTLGKLPTVEEYETMSRQFEILQSFQLLENERDAGDTAGNGEYGEDNTSPKAGESLEKRLLGKVKSLEGRLTRMRVELGERDSRVSELLTLVRSFEEQVGDQKELISKLEEGINAMTGDQASVHTLKRRAVAASLGDSESAPNLDALKGDDNQESESTWDWGEKHQAEGLQSIIREEPSMLDIVAGQRDRFRARSMELEEDNRKLMERIEKLTSDLDSLKSDNVRLYEKIRFVQSYKQSSGSLAPGASAVAIEPSPSTGDEEDGTGNFLGKYRSMYEDMVNPYTIFNRRERHKRMSEMSAPERLTLRASQKVLSTKTSRLIVFFYIIALHVFVALVLGFSSSMVCDNEVTTKAQH